MSSNSLTLIGRRIDLLRLEPIGRSLRALSGTGNSGRAVGAGCVALGTYTIHYTVP